MSEPTLIEGRPGRGKLLEAVRILLESLNGTLVITNIKMPRGGLEQ